MGLSSWEYGGGSLEFGKLKQLQIERFKIKSQKSKG